MGATPKLVGDIAADTTRPATVAKAFRERLRRGAMLYPAGTAKTQPLTLLTEGYGPRFRLQLFDVELYLGGPWQNEDLRYFVGYVIHPQQARKIFPRLLYKDVSLTWRCASHYVPSENWIGKGDLRVVMNAGVEHEESDEATTDLPLEIHAALEHLAKAAGRIPYDRAAVGMVLRNAPPGRLEPYADFLKPREQALRDRQWLVNGGRPIARFTRRNDPESLVFTAGFEPDLASGVLSHHAFKSSLYGGSIERFRVASRNRAVQYQFVVAPAHLWIASVQATTRALSTYALRVVDAVVDEALLLPGYEYHYREDPDDPESLYTQIPPGFAGAQSRVDPSRADAGPWLKRVPILQAFSAALRAGRLGDYPGA